ncbi:MAG: restriction endonuclease, partial [Microthrixaceae bacterium]|nr:restriction endonuclease [Microthrixaceae bacterium]
NGRQLVDMIFDHYEQLDLEWRRLLPLKRTYVLDHETDAG